MVSVTIAGAAGRMGRTLIQAVNNHTETTLAAALEYPAHPLLGNDSGELSGIGANHVPLISDVNEAAAQCDVWIDFTLPEACCANLQACRQHKANMVIGTTGLDDQQTELLTQTSEEIAIMWAPNMSIGVNLCFALLKKASQVLEADEWDAEVLEIHHGAKIDAPSGTALKMGEIIANERGVNLKERGVFSREGRTGKRHTGDIGFATLRGGDVIGDHTAYFAGVGERIEITHRASSRMSFAQGALQAARWLKGKPRGLFNMNDVLGLN